jgi:hypothetical protein
MNHSQPTLWWNIRHWWYNHISGPLFGPYLTWRQQTPEYRHLMTDIGRSFLMREMRLRRIPGALRVQQTYRSINPAQWRNGEPVGQVIDPSDIVVSSSGYNAAETWDGDDPS